MADLALRWPYLGDRTLLIELVKSAARNELQAVDDLERWLTAGGPHL